MTEVSSALDTVYLDMVRYLNLPNLRPYLRQERMLTDDEFEKLDIGPSNTTQQAIESLVKILKRKGPGHEYQFLTVLKQSVEKDPHQGHLPIICALEDRLAHIQSGGIAGDVESDGIFLQGVTTPVTAHQPQLQDLPVRHKHTLQLVGNDEHFDDIKKAALRCKVIQANENIIMKFASLVLGIYRLLKQKEVPVEEVRMSLLFLGCLRNRPKGENIPVFSPTSDVARAETLHSLIECLHSYSSWYNYGLLKFAAIEFGKDDGKQLIGDYEDELACYFEAIIACQCPHFSLTTGIPPGFDQLMVKVDWDYMSRKVQDVAVFQSKLSSLLQLEPEVFILKSVEEGCMLFSWAVPAPIVPHVLSEVLRLQNILAQQDVLLVEVGGRAIEPIKKPSADHVDQVIVHVTKEDVDWNGAQQNGTTSAALKPSQIPVRETLSNESCVSSLSELTYKSSTDNSDYGLGKRLSNNSTLLDIERNSLTAEEAEIVSIYSKSSVDADCSISSPSSPAKEDTLNSPSPHSITPGNAHLDDKREIFQASLSEADLLVDTKDIASLSRNTRAHSLPNCTTERRPGRRHKLSRIAKAKKFFKHLLPSKRTSSASQGSNLDDSLVLRSPTVARPPTLQLLNLTAEPSPRKVGQCSFHYYYSTEQLDTIPSSLQEEGHPIPSHATYPVQCTSLYTSIHSTALFRPPSPILLGKGYPDRSTSDECDTLSSLDSPLLPVGRVRSHRSNSAPHRLLQNVTLNPASVLFRETHSDINSPTVPQCPPYYVTLYPGYSHRVASPVSMSQSSRGSSGYYSSESQSDFRSMMSSINSQESLHRIPSRSSSLKNRNYMLHPTHLSNANKAAFPCSIEDPLRHSFH